MEADDIAAGIALPPKTIKFEAQTDNFTNFQRMIYNEIKVMFPVSHENFLDKLISHLFKIGCVKQK